MVQPMIITDKTGFYYYPKLQNNRFIRAVRVIRSAYNKTDNKFPVAFLLEI